MDKNDIQERLSQDYSDLKIRYMQLKIQLQYSEQLVLKLGKENQRLQKEIEVMDSKIESLKNETVTTIAHDEYQKKQRFYVSLKKYDKQTKNLNLFVKLYHQMKDENERLKQQFKSEHNEQASGDTE